jgi:hypothetical protein
MCFGTNSVKIDDQETRPPGFDCGWIRSARRRSAWLPCGPCGGTRQQGPYGGRAGRLAAGRRHQASPGGYREADRKIGWRDRRRARGSQLICSVLPAKRAATRRCRSATGRSHVWPPTRSSPTEISLRSWRFCLCLRGLQRRSKLAGGHSAYTRRTRAVMRRPGTLADDRGASSAGRIWQNPSIPAQQGCETRPIYWWVAASGSGG